MNRLSLFSSKTSSPSNDQKILQNKSEKLHIYHRAASREVKNQDVISSWKSLDILLKQNNVRREEKMGRFYEKPTKKRSRLRSERHRKRFKKGIRYLVSIVKEMKRILFHIIYLRSIFDIYFTSPLVHGMQQFKVENHAPAKRLFLIIGDGLRADKLFESHINTETNIHETFAPFLQSIALNRGCFGVSHTRVPTESRPGHIAIIAGFYEDVSAVTKGWKANPVNFDSVFNQSRYTWSFGSPDILPIFTHGASNISKIETFMYEKSMEDFSKDSTILDTWVFDKVTELFKNSTSDETIKKKLSQDKIIQLDILIVIDTRIEKIVELVEKYYNDNKTAWIFTSDHGMSDLGSHGDGHPDNTRTPLIVWGPGINKPDKLNVTGHDSFSKNWTVNVVKRIDVLQADIAPLMAYLIGLNFPMNSIGQIPLDYLSCPLHIKSQIALTNALEIAEQYEIKHELKSSTKIAFKPFKHLNNETHNLHIYKNRIKTLINNHKYDEAIKICKEMIELCLTGLQYLQTYDRLFLCSIITFGYIGWIIFMFIQILDIYILTNIYQTKRTIFSFAVISYSQRVIFTGYFILISFWPLTYSIKFIQNNRILVSLWSISCLITSTFTLFNTVKKENLTLIGGIIMLISGIIYLFFGDSLIKKHRTISSVPKITISFQLGLLILSIIVTYSSVLSLQAKKGLPLGNQVVSWVVLALSLITPLITLMKKQMYYVHNLVIIFLMFSPTFIILSISYEGLFYICFFATLILWVQVEYQIRQEISHQNKSTEFKRKQKLFSEDLRTALFYLFFIQEAFFGTGNIASISSFSLDSVYRLIPVFNPFSQAAILLFKLLVPFIIISINLGILNRKLGIPRSTLFMIVLAISDILTLNFFYLVKNEGSWLEIGSTISSFCIGNFLILYIIILEKISDFLIGNSYIPTKRIKLEKK
ncbi:hypothetical protein PORY_002109 [Pneumocystis oryctolagi]|uniref:Uncharacterized protein n=1 Tax=Pneumocystis oryctolagi TaxID=42067 RepID=A0ACB7CH10_9ASCO|nr:hypothetical protein PORY_002109 [Pneumocystis oryctolagi]